MSSTKRRWTICAGAPWLGHVVDQLAERQLAGCAITPHGRVAQQHRRALIWRHYDYLKDYHPDPTAPRRGELHACFDHIFHRRTGFVSAPSPFMRLHPKGSMGNRRTNRSASSESLPCVLVYRWSSYFPSSPERPASLMAFDQPEIWRDTNNSECDIRLDNTKRRITQSQFRWSRPAQHSWPAERPTSARPHRLPQPANVRQQRPGPYPCYCVGTSSRLVAGPAA